MPTFSIVIPTRARSDTLRHSLRTALDQTYADIEIVVHESGADPAIEALLNEVNDSRVRFYKTGKPVRMTENWERALDQVRGDYVFYLGDDDGLLPDACAIAAQFFQSTTMDLLSWPHTIYYWPRYFDLEMRNRLCGSYSTTLSHTIRNSRNVLSSVYRFRESYAQLPMIYNSFVSRKLIERARSNARRYFLGSAPDVTSGVVNAHLSEQFARCNRPLSIAGISHHSTGHRVAISGDPNLRREATLAAFGSIILHPTMVESPNLTLAVGNELLIAKDIRFPNSSPTLGYLEMLWEAAQTINAIPSQYEEVKQDILAIKAINRIPFDESSIPAPYQRVANLPLGIREFAPGNISIDLDGRTAAIENIYDAVLFLSRQLAPAEAATTQVEPIHDESIPAPGHEPTVLEFALKSGWANLLGLGWCEAEDWGVWSQGSRSELTLPFAQSIDHRLRIQIEGRAAACLANPTINIEVRSGGKVLAQGSFGYLYPRVNLELEPIDLTGLDRERRLHLVFTIDAPLSPARAGIGSDLRDIGFGLERIIISWYD